MRTKLLALFRDETSQDSAEYALVAAVIGLIFLSAAKSLSNGRNTAFAAVVLAPKGSLSGVLDAILDVGKKRDAQLRDLRIALISGKDDEALKLARELCGLAVLYEKGY